MDVADPTALSLSTAAAAQAAGIPYAVYGGVALAIWGEPRLTRDADIAVRDASLEEIMAALRGAGIRCETAFERVRFGGLWVSRATVIGSGPGQVNNLDVVQPLDVRYAERAMERAVSGRFEDRRLHVISPEDFILFKVLSTRERDLEDAASVWRRNRDGLNVRSISATARGLAERIPDHDVRGKLERVRGAAKGSL